jgi:opacity protein-like surface antigen
MKKKYLYALVFSAMTLSSQAVLADEGGWGFLPVAGDDYQAEPALSLVGGSMSPEADGMDADTVAGLEFSLNCPLLKAPKGVIRQQISLVRYDDAGAEISTVELNPHYLIDINKDFSVGFGPGIGYAMLDAAGVDEGAFSLQLGASLHYDLSDSLFLGAEARYQWTQDLDDTNEDLNNSRVLAKFGLKF